jgi:hypothetical protein
MRNPVLQIASLVACVLSALSSADADADADAEELTAPEAAVNTIASFYFETDARADKLVAVITRLGLSLDSTGNSRQRIKLDSNHNIEVEIEGGIVKLCSYDGFVVDLPTTLKLAHQRFRLGRPMIAYGPLLGAEREPVMSPGGVSMYALVGVHPAFGGPSGVMTLSFIPAPHTN